MEHSTILSLNAIYKPDNIIEFLNCEAYVGFKPEWNMGIMRLSDPVKNEQFQKYYILPQFIKRVFKTDFLYMQLLNTPVNDQSVPQDCIQKMFPNKYNQLIQFLLDIKSSPFYSGYQEFMIKYFNPQFAEILNNQYSKYDTYDVLNIVETKQSVIQQTYFFYKFYIVFYLNTLYEQYSYVEFNIQEFLNSIISQNLYHFETRQSETNMTAYGVYDQIKYNHFAFVFNFNQINTLFNDLLSKRNVRLYDQHYANNIVQNERGVYQMSLLSVVLQKFKTSYNIIQNDNQLDIVPTFQQYVIRGLTINGYSNENKLLQCSVCANKFHYDQLFQYSCCGNFICPYCIYEHQFQHIMCQATVQNEHHLMCPCCKDNTCPKTITYHVFGRRLPDYEYSSAYSDIDRENGYYKEYYNGYNDDQYSNIYSSNTYLDENQNDYQEEHQENSFLLNNNK